jgi:hypothetical protein
VATRLMSLRNVPADELEEIHALMERHDIGVYETEAGTWGTTLPGLWLHDDTRFTEARALLDAYAVERQARARQELAALKAAGKARTFMDIARENPVRFVLYLVLAGATAWFSLVPFISLAGGPP